MQAPLVLRVLLRIGLLEPDAIQCDAIRGNTDRSRQDRAGFARAAAKQRDLLADCEILGIGPGFDLNRVAGDGRVNGSLDRGELPVAYLRHKGLGGIFPHHKAAVLILDRHIAVLAQGLRHFSGEGAAGDGNYLAGSGPCFFRLIRIIEGVGLDCINTFCGFPPYFSSVSSHLSPKKVHLYYN